jgi:hypothetical protein
MTPSRSPLIVAAVEFATEVAIYLTDYNRWFFCALTGDLCEPDLAAQVARSSRQVHAKYRALKALQQPKEMTDA